MILARKGFNDDELNIVLSKGNRHISQIIVPYSVNMDTEHYINHTLAKMIELLDKVEE